MGQRTILHVDLDAFYASVEQRDDPSLRGQPVIVGGHRQRGVVCAASYEARRFGVHSAMPMVIALKRCPRAVVRAPRMGYYGEVSQRFFQILDRYSPHVEGLSLDEAFLDVTGEERLLGDGKTIAQRIKAETVSALELVCSVGVAPNKFLAKIASDLQKPNGLVVVDADQIAAFLAPLPLGRLWTVGEVTEEKLRALGLRTIGDVARAGEPLLAAQLGKEHAHRLLALSRGDDARPVVSDRPPVSLGHECTFDVDHFDRLSLVPYLLDQADRACARVREIGARARTVTLKVKYADHTLVTRRTTLPRATSDGRVCADAARALLAQVPDIERRGVRLTGVSLSSLEPRATPTQLSFDEPQRERGEELGQTLDRIAERFGRGAVTRAVLLGDKDE